MAGDWSELPEGHVLLKLSALLPDILKEADYSEMYGVQLIAPTETEQSPFSTLLILQKFLRANANNVSNARAQLLKALKWRKEFEPLKAKEEIFSSERFQGLGFVTRIDGVPQSENAEDVAVWNVYGAVKNMKKTFGNTDDFVRWRVALQEITISHLHLDTADVPIPDYGKGVDPYQAYQIHDYKSVSFLRQPAEVKAASKKTIQLFQDVYPETMAKKYFVNVPLVMQWMFGAMSVFMAKETVAKMQWMSSGSELRKSLGSGVPAEYGGSGPELTSGNSPQYDDGTGGEDEAPVAANSASDAPEAAEMPAAPVDRPGESDEAGPSTAEAGKAQEDQAPVSPVHHVSDEPPQIPEMSNGEASKVSSEEPEALPAPVSHQA